MRYLLVITFFVSSATFAFITGKEWKTLQNNTKTGYVMGVFESTYQLKTSSIKQQKIYGCARKFNFTSEDFINLVDTQYKDLTQYTLPAFAVLYEGLEKACKSEIEYK